MERRDEFGRPLGDDFNRPLDADRNRFYDRTDDSSLAWIGGLFAFMLVIGGLFYAFSGSNGDRVATNASQNPAPMTRPAPTPTPAPLPTPAR